VAAEYPDRQERLPSLEFIAIDPGIEDYVAEHQQAPLQRYIAL